MNIIVIMLFSLAAALALALMLAAVSRWLRIRIDLTPIEHAVAAVAVQSGWALAMGDLWAGAALGIAIFVGREHAQAEYRYIHANGGNRYATPLPAELACLHPRWWSKDSVLDVVVPASACLALAYGATHAAI